MIQFVVSLLLFGLSGSVHATDTNKPVVYHNEKYKFSYDLPGSWAGFKVVEQKWGGENTPQGPWITLRHPKWSAEHLWQDIPILIFTEQQWKDLKAGKFTVSAAPIDPEEFGRSHGYVFAYLPRFIGYDEAEGQAEVGKLIRGKPFHAE